MNTCLLHRVPESCCKRLYRMIACSGEHQTELMVSNLLEVRGLKRHYGSVAAVDGIDLNVRTGEIYGFLGVNGAGKTTTIRMLMGIIAAEFRQKTQVFLDGLPLRRANLFFHKFAAACCVIVFIVLFLQSYQVLFFWLSSDSVTPDLSCWSLLTKSFVLFLLGYTIVGVSTILSFSRKWFPLIAGLVLWAVIWLQSSDIWLSSCLDTAVLLRPISSDTNVFFPWKQIAGHFVPGSLGWLGALVATQYRDGILSKNIDRMSTSNR